MKKTIWSGIGLIVVTLVTLLLSYKVITAQAPIDNNLEEQVLQLEMSTLGASDSISFLESSESAENISSESAKQTIQEKKDQDITEPIGQATSTLATYLNENEVEFQGWNFLSVAIRGAVSKGFPANIIVLLLLFPLIASIIAFSRYIIGLKGFGIYTPAVLSVAFVSTGVGLGLVMFAFILLAALILKQIMRKNSLPHLSKTALVLWGVAVATLGFFLVAAYFDLTSFYSLSIFPLLIMILLSENFMDLQLFSNTKAALRQTGVTLLLATICAFLISSSTIQKLVILNPEITLILTVIIDIFIGKYTGLRLLEHFRFRSLLKGE